MRKSAAVPATVSGEFLSHAGPAGSAATEFNLRHSLRRTWEGEAAIPTREPGDRPKRVACGLVQGLIRRGKFSFRATTEMDAGFPIWVFLVADVVAYSEWKQK